MAAGRSNSGGFAAWIKRPWVLGLLGAGTLAVIAGAVFVLNSKKSKTPAATVAGAAGAPQPGAADSGLTPWSPNPDYIKGYVEQKADRYRLRFPPNFVPAGVRPLPQPAGRTVVHKTWRKSGIDPARNAYFHVVIVDVEGADLPTTNDAVAKELDSLLTAAVQHEAISQTTRATAIHGSLAGKPAALGRVEGTTSLLPGVTEAIPTNVVALVRIEPKRIVFVYGVCNDAKDLGDYSELEVMLLTLSG
jgi:hypothetical protein